MSAIVTARDAAYDLIYRYVERGDSLQSLKDGHQGSYGSPYSASIGGCMDTPSGRKCYGPEWITVTKIMGQPCAERIHLPRLYAEIQHELSGGEVQATLL